MSSVHSSDIDEDMMNVSGYEIDEHEEYVEDYDLEAYLSRGIDPMLPTNAKPGSEEKVLMLSARYAAGIPLWHNEDCYDHGPGLATEGAEHDFAEEEEEVEVDEFDF